MFSTLLGRRKPAPERFDLISRRCAEPRTLTRPPIPHRAADDRLYFAVRSYAANGVNHVLQYAFADDRGNVVMSAFGRASCLALMEGATPPPDMAVEPLEPQALDGLLLHVCQGANLVAFGRVLQAGLLPAGIAHSAATVDCAWRRFLKIGRQRRLAFDRSEPLTLDDALAAANLPPRTSDDASARALAVRDLWTWMDRVELTVV